MMAEEYDTTYPRPIGEIDLAQKASELGIKHFIASISSFVRDCRVQIVHVTKAREFQQYGIEYFSFSDYSRALDEKKLQAVPIISTLVQLPWDPKFAWIACELYLDDKPFDQCPRQAMKRVLKMTADKGLQFKTSIEFEFQLFKKDVHEGLIERDVPWNDYLGRRQTMQCAEFFDKIFTVINDLGWKPEQSEKEMGPSQMEVNVKYTDALVMADRHFFFKFLVKALAENDGYRAIFMPKAGKDLGGNGMHFNFSIWDKITGENLMPDKSNKKLTLSSLGESVLAGIMANMKEGCALVCPTVNSYKRLNSTTNFLRIVGYSRESKWPAVRVVETGERIEYRWPDGAANPYLLTAAMVAMCLDGIDNNIELDPKQYFDRRLSIFDPPVPDYEFPPASLEEACGLLKSNKTFRKYLGDAVVDGFIQLKFREVSDSRNEVNPWEIARADDY